MPIFLVKYTSTFENVAPVNADSIEEAIQLFEDADFYQKHLGTEVKDVTIADTFYEKDLRDKGYW